MQYTNEAQGDANIKASTWLQNFTIQSDNDRHTTETVVAKPVNKTACT